MKAYKAFNKITNNPKAGICRGFLFEEGQTYTITTTLGLCESGFHFCKDLVLTLLYYPIKYKISENRYAEVEILGDVIYEQPTKHKGCTNKIKIVRFLTDEEMESLVIGDTNSGTNNSGSYNSGDRNSGSYNSGDRNSGSYNSGDRNSGSYNSGVHNSGAYDSGDYNSGKHNSGNYNSGNCNSGHWNAGHYNSGHYNSGHYNSGHYNSGHYNSSSYNTGHFNTTTPETIRAFNKEVLREDWEKAYKPAFLHFSLTEGKTYKECFIKSWNNANKDDRIRIKELPGFDADIFYEISGIRV